MDRGVTIALAEAGPGAMERFHTEGLLSGGARLLIEDQRAALEMVMDLVGGRRSLTDSYVREIHRRLAAPAEGRVEAPAEQPPAARRARARILPAGVRAGRDRPPAGVARGARGGWRLATAVTALSPQRFGTGKVDRLGKPLLPIHGIADRVLPRSPNLTLDAMNVLSSYSNKQLGREGTMGQEDNLRGENVSTLPTAEPRPTQPSLERYEFVTGLFEELHEQLTRHLTHVKDLSRAQGRIEVGERALVATRDYLLSILETTADEHVPEDWRDILDQVQFIGVRLGVACTDLIERHGPLTIEELHARLNDGQFRFRTSTPLREINAALIRNSRARKEGERWVYVRPTEDAVAS